jgi:ferritin-like metal-binding protein YciE
MAQSLTETLIVGLKNAHALERQAIEILERQGERLGAYPDLRDRVSRHLEESRKQQAAVGELLDRLGARPSALKEGVMSMMGNAQAMVHAAAEDEILKNVFACYAFEHYEIAAYRSLIAMAREGGFHDVEETCRQILAQEEAMAEWLGENLDATTRAYLVQQGHGPTA